MLLKCTCIILDSTGNEAQDAYTILLLYTVTVFGALLQPCFPQDDLVDVYTVAYKHSLHFLFTCKYELIPFLFIGFVLLLYSILHMCVATDNRDIKVCHAVCRMQTPEPKVSASPITLAGVRHYTAQNLFHSKLLHFK